MAKKKKKKKPMGTVFGLDPTRKLSPQLLKSLSLRGTNTGSRSRTRMGRR